MEIPQEPTIETSEVDEQELKEIDYKKLDKEAVPSVVDSDKAEADLKQPEQVLTKDKVKKGSISKDKKPIKTKQGDKDIQKDNLDSTIVSRPDVSSPETLSETKPLSKETNEVRTSDGTTSSLDEKQKTEEKMTMEEKIAAKKAKKGIKAEEPVFAGMKLKKSQPVQRQLQQEELEVVELKAHKFEKIPQNEMVKCL